MFVLLKSGYKSYNEFMEKQRQAIHAAYMLSAKYMGTETPENQFRRQTQQPKED